MINPHDDDLERLLLARSPQFQALMDRSRESLKEGKGLSRDEFWKRVGSRGEKKRTRAAPRCKKK
jgi:hypothetical protein